VTFRESDLALLDQLEEIEVETLSPDGVVHRTIVWPVVRDSTLYLRSYKGPSGRWYREALANPSVALLVDGQRLPARVEAATDAASIEACSASLRAKYRDDASLQAMLVADVLPTTLRVVPA
jgi:hypothetical protein